jgi:hypothetical protein
MWFLLKKSLDLIQKFPGYTKPCESAKHAEALQLKAYLFYSSNHPEVRVRFTFNEMRLN